MWTGVEPYLEFAKEGWGVARVEPCLLGVGAWPGVEPRLESRVRDWGVFDEEGQAVASRRHQVTPLALARKARRTWGIHSSTTEVGLGVTAMGHCLVGKDELRSGQHKGKWKLIATTQSSRRGNPL